MNEPEQQHMILIESEIYMYPHEAHGIPAEDTCQVTLH